VLLKDDINHIEDYIALEKLRFNETLDITFTTKNISDSATIAPMLLLPFIENSFKHGSIKNGLLTIKIEVSCTESYIYFSIENSLANATETSNGIGLENLKKRLSLLYKDNYQLNITKLDDVFKVKLKLNCTNN
jgi:hypothetical protein